MGEFSKVLLAIDNAHTVPQTALDWGPDLGRQFHCTPTTLNLPRFCSSIEKSWAGIYKLAAHIITSQIYSHAFYTHNHSFVILQSLAHNLRWYNTVQVKISINLYFSALSFQFQ